MATKLKNLTRHWCLKLLVILVMISAGLYSMTLVFNFIQTYGEEGLNMQYEFSEAYYDKLDSYYAQVYKVYYSNPKQVQVNQVERLAQKKGYHYFIHKTDGKIYTDLAHVKKFDDFYNEVRVSEQIGGDSDGYRMGGSSYFQLTPPNQDQILIGLSSEQYTLESKAFMEKYYKRTAPLFYGLAACLLTILIGLIYLAIVSGRKPNSEELHFHRLDDVFLDVYLAFWIFAECLQLISFSELARNLPETGIFVFAMILAAIFGLFGVLYWTMVCKRFKNRTILRHTLIGFVFRHTIGSVFRCFSRLFNGVKQGPFQLLPIAIGLGFLVINAITVVLGFALSAGAGFPGFLIGAFIYMTGFGLLIGYLIYQDQQLEHILVVLNRIANGQLNEKVTLTGTRQHKRLAAQINQLTDGLNQAVEKELKAERMKAELITNVSHDLKTPLTSIISYVDLLKSQGLDAPDAEKYLEILDQKSQRLKQLTEDLFEASKASSGNLQVNIEPLNLQDLIRQATGEFAERFESANLSLMVDLPQEPLIVLADGRYLWRVLENIFLNVYKYAAPHTRVYLTLSKFESLSELTLKNISHAPLNLTPEALLERFSRGDLSRNTEGSGLGLSIAKSLTKLQKGSFELQTDGDLFKVIIHLPTQS